MYRNYPLYERINGLVRLAKYESETTLYLLHELINEINIFSSNAGYWTNVRKKYFNTRRIEMMVQRQLILYNYANGINNSVAVKKFNQGFTRTFARYEWESIKQHNDTQLTEWSEDTIVEKFTDINHEIVTLLHLKPIFIIWMCGIILSTVVFLMEHALRAFKQNRLREKRVWTKQINLTDA